MNYTMIEVSSN